MYLSRLTLGEHAADQKRFWQIGQPYALHQEVWRLQDRPANAARDFLFRLDVVAGRPSLLVLSPRPCLDGSGLWRVESKPFAPKLRVGQQLDFRLRANPVVRHGHDRHDVVMHSRVRARASGEPDHATTSERAQQSGAAWLEARAQEHGFRLIDVRVDGYRVVEIQRNGHQSGRTIRFGQVDFEGRLQVLDPDRLVATLYGGVGPSRAFGCGLMLMRRTD